MTGSEGAFPVSGSASQTVSPGISRREWYVGQLIASGRFDIETSVDLVRAGIVRTMFDIAEDLIVEEQMRISRINAAAQELLDELKKQSSSAMAPLWLETALSRSESEIPVKADPEAWNPMFGVPEPPAALVDEHSADEQGRMDALTDLKERGLL